MGAETGPCKAGRTVDTDAADAAGAAECDGEDRRRGSAGSTVQLLKQLPVWLRAGEGKKEEGAAVALHLRRHYFYD